MGEPGKEHCQLGAAAKRCWPGLFVAFTLVVGIMIGTVVSGRRRQ